MEIKYNGLTWLNIKKPTSEDLGFLRDNFNFHPLVLEELSRPTFHPNFEDYDDHLFIVMHAPVLEANQKESFVQELDIIVSKNSLVTVHYHTINNLEDFFNKTLQDENQQKNYLGKGAGFLLYHILQNLLQLSMPDLNIIAQKINLAEQNIFKGKERKMVAELSRLRRNILDFRRSLKSQEAILKVLPISVEKVFGKVLRPYYEDLLGKHNKIWDIVENDKETIDVLYETNESLLSTKLSDVMGVLTIFSAILLPINTLATIYSMNFVNLPLVNQHNGVFIILGVMLALVIGLFAVFKTKKWI